ncbi:hypothetical protein TCDM_07558 [Trypanosoma cruzi Dm28c]|uniref:Uncharacterized protein n=1 Tax=Trypanosoma cruzi Dm28c TaxID=1416333 RepID=V5BIT4_TRYCR|nr:hypothetical protein TCDM_07558 [Trypanosoma cruzi Dm28c]
MSYVAADDVVDISALFFSFSYVCVCVCIISTRCPHTWPRHDSPLRIVCCCCCCCFLFLCACKERGGKKVGVVEGR